MKTYVKDFDGFLNESRLKGKLIEYNQVAKKLFAAFQKSNKQTITIKQMISDFYDIDRKIKKMSSTADILKKDVKQLGTELFDAQDRFLTRVIQIEEFTVTLSAESESTKPNYEKAFKALVEQLNPEIQAMADTLLKKFEETKEVASRLTVNKDSVEEGIMDTLRNWKESILDWFFSFQIWDDNVNAIMTEIKRQVELNY